MANIVESVGYALGKLHTGLIAYLCDLWNGGDCAPFERFCQSLCINIPRRGVLCPHREWKGLDLVIFGSDDTTPLVAIEMKVDDHEHMTTLDKGMKPDWQTVLYPQLLPRCPCFLFVTLGIGEFYHRPYGNRFRPVGLQDFHQALQTIHSNNPVICDWKEAVASELKLREMVLAKDRTRIKEYRRGAWDVTLLHDLRERLRQTDGERSIYEGATIYLHGTGPDTILHFDIRGQFGPFFMEINRSGKLNLKALLAGFATPTADEYVGKAVSWWQDFLRQKGCAQEAEPRKRRGKTRTLLSFDIGLRQCGGFQYEGDAKDTVRRAGSILQAFSDGVNREPPASP
jgi:hypothetical protein